VSALPITRASPLPVPRVSPVFSRQMAIAAAVTILATAIYPANHWEHATKLTPKNFEPFVKESVDAGKTLFVRWIASAG